MDDEIKIDFRKYIDWVFDWAWLIILSGMVLFVITILVSLIIPPPFVARATIVMLRSRSEVSLGSSINTLSQEDISMEASGQLPSGASATALQALEADRVARRLNSLLGMVGDGAIAQQVSEQLKGILTDDERNPSRLIENVSAEMVDPKNSGAEISSGSTSEAIYITVKNRNPVKAAAIANAWAQTFETTVNSIYGGSANAPYAQIDEQVAQALATYEKSQAAYLQFRAEQDRTEELKRQMAEETGIIERLRVGRQTSINAIVDKQVDMKQQLIFAYLDNETQNRLLAFNKGQEGKRQILALYLDAELANRVAALTRDRDVRLRMFNASIQADVANRLHIFEQQRTDYLNKLDSEYARKQRLEDFLLEANTMLEQLVRGGDASARSNALALIGLKGRLFAVTTGLPGFDKLDLKSESIDSLAAPRSAADQIADLNGLILALNSEIASLEKSIQDQTDIILKGEGYQLLDMLSPEYQASLNSSGWEGDAGAGSGAVPKTLDEFIIQQYNALFTIGNLAKDAINVDAETQIFQEIQVEYPNLFSKDAVMELSELSGVDNELVNQARQMTEDLLNMKGWEDVATEAVKDKPLSKEIAQREENVRQLLAKVVQLEQTQKELGQQRDLDWAAYTTLLSKQQEVKIVAATESTEVRFASQAVPPKKRMFSRLIISTAGLFIGLSLGVVGAFVLSYKGANSDDLRRRLIEEVKMNGSKLRRSQKDKGGSNLADEQDDAKEDQKNV